MENESYEGVSDENTELTHFKKHKAVYISAGLVAAVGTAAFFVGRRSMRVSPETLTKAKLNNAALVAINSPMTNVLINLPERSSASKPIQDAVTGTVYASISEAARNLKLSRLKILKLIEDGAMNLIDVTSQD